MTKMTFDEVLSYLSDERHIDRSEVKAKDLRRKVWVNANGLPGCLYDYQGINLSKKDAIESAKQIACDYPKGFITNLKRNHITYMEGYMYTIYHATIDELL